MNKDDSCSLDNKLKRANVPNDFRARQKSGRFKLSCQYYFASDAAIAPLSGNIFFAKNHGIVFPKRKSAQDVATVIFVHWWIR